MEILIFLNNQSLHNNIHNHINCKYLCCISDIVWYDCNKNRKDTYERSMTDVIVDLYTCDIVCISRTLILTLVKK